MNDLVRSFSRALVSQLHPRMLLQTVLPFVLATLLWCGVLWWFGDALLATTRSFLENFPLTSWIYGVLDWFGLQSVRAFVAPIFVIVMAVPLVIASMLVFISIFSVPAVIRHLERSYPELVKEHGGSVFGSVVQSLACTMLFLLLVMVTLPLWLIPPLFALIPPLLWGWLTYRVMSYDALAEHATAEERKTVMKRHRGQLLLIGIASGLLGSAPTLLWVSWAHVIFVLPILLAGSLWLYVLIFIFSALWFGHYCLYALKLLRIERAVAKAPAAAVTLPQAEPPRVEPF